jgi:GNAT superfamily N-acetyltransferase
VNSALDRALQGYLRHAVQIRQIDRVGPFLASFTPHSENPFLNYAIPDDEAEPSAADVQALIEAFERRGRIPRLEYFPTVAPAVEAALLAAGFSVEGRLPVMTCTPDSLRDVPAPEGIELLVPSSEEDHAAALSAANEAYGEPRAPDRADVARRMAAAAAGLGSALARDAVSGEPAGSGVYSIPYNGVTEVAGIGVRPPYRRRGIARALTAFLTREAFAAGVTLPFLMCEEENEERVYGRAGYMRATEILHTSRPS